MPELLESAFFPSRQSEQLERKNLILDVDEATGAPRLTTFDLFSSQPRNGLFVANNPVNLTDPMGTTVVPGAGSDIGAFNAAIGYLSQSPTFAGIYGRLQNSSNVYTVNTNSSGQDYFQANASGGTIAWDPSKGLAVSNGTGIFSPEIALAHELAGHGGDWETDPQGFTRDANTRLPGYDDQEERNAVATETRIAKDLHEPTRSDHRGKLVTVRGPSGNIVQVPSNFFLWLNAFPESLLAHLLADSPTAQNLGIGSYGSNGNSHSSQHVSGPPPPNLSFAYTSQMKNP